MASWVRKKLEIFPTFMVKDSASQLLPWLGKDANSEGARWKFYSSRLVSHFTDLHQMPPCILRGFLHNRSRWSL